MAYTTPRTWVAGELVTASLLNVHLRDNLDAIKAPPTDLYNVNEGADYTTSSTSFGSVDATDLSLTITTTGGDIWVWFFGNVNHSGGNLVYFDITLDAVRQGGDDGLIGCDVATTTVPSTPIAFTFLIQSVAAGSHTIALQWKTSGATATLYAGAATGGGDLHPQFGIREMS